MMRADQDGSDGDVEEAPAPKQSAEKRAAGKLGKMKKTAKAKGGAKKKLKGLKGKLAKKAGAGAKGQKTQKKKKVRSALGRGHRVLYPALAPCLGLHRRSSAWAVLC